MDICLDLCNALSAKLGRRSLFMRTPGSALSKQILVNWVRVSSHPASDNSTNTLITTFLQTTDDQQVSLEDTPVHLRPVHPSRQNAYDTIVFVHILRKSQTFCLFEYSLKAHRNEALTAINPCTCEVDADVNSICRMAEFFREDRNPAEVSCFVLNPSVRLTVPQAQKSCGFSTRRVALDGGKGASGFWSVWLALSRVLRGTLHEVNLRTEGGIVSVKERLFRIYQSFVADPEGLRKWVLDDATDGLDVEEAVFSLPSGTPGQPPLELGPNEVVSASQEEL